VPHREKDAGLAAGVEHPRCVGAMQRQRFFTEHLLAGVGTGDDLCRMQRVRRRQQYRLDRGIGQDGIEGRRKIEVVAATEIPRTLDVRLDRPDDLQGPVAAGGFHDIAAPASETDDGG